MCGISGFLNFDGTRLEKQVLVRVAGRLSHRGPDGEGHLLADVESGATGLESGDLGLAHNRLAIIDLSERASQPMTDPSGELTLVFNGEIYNYRELRDELGALGYSFRTSSDTETILHAYREWGNDCLHRLRGMFGFTLWDRNKRSLLVARDRIGIKPVYYYNHKQRFAFASELKALLEIPWIHREVSIPALNDYLETRYVPGPQSILQNIFKLEPGHCLSVDRDGVHRHSYWDIPSPETTQPGQDHVEHLHQTLKSTIRQHLVSDVPVGAFLSGGVDSSLVTAIAQNEHADRLKTFTIGFDDADFDEAPFAARIAAHLGTEHHQHYISESDVMLTLQQLYKHYDEPFADASAMPTLCLSRLSSEVFKTVLSGDGGDELFHGYRWFAQIEKSRGLYAIPYPLRWLMFNPLTTGIRRFNNLSGLRQRSFGRLISHKTAIFPDRIREKLTGETKGHYLQTLEKSFPGVPADRHELYERLGRHGMKTWLPDDFMVKTDRASMAFGLEIRVPLLDHEVIECAMKIPPDLKHRDGSSKYILRQLLKEYIPPQLFERPKKGFSVPLTRWLQTVLNPLMKQTLSADNIGRHGILDPYTVQQQIAAFDRNPPMEATRIWLLLNFQLWCDEYLASKSTGRR